MPPSRTRISHTACALALAAAVAACASPPAASPLSASIGVVVDEQRGAVVIEAMADSARRAGLRVGDAVRRYNGTKVIGARHFQRLVEDTVPGAAARVEVFRDGQLLEIELRAIQVDLTPRA